MKMEQTECSKMLAYEIQMLGNRRKYTAMNLFSSLGATNSIFEHFGLLNI
jgi:hypothetical protein